MGTVDRHEAYAILRDAQMMGEEGEATGSVAAHLAFGTVGVEVTHRAVAALRRAERLKLSQGIQRSVYQIKDLTIDLARHQVLLGEEEVHFTQNEFKIIELLAIHAGKVLTYDFILEHIWGPYGGTGSNQILRVNMANIRRKLKENPSEPKYIHTELGIGYRMLDD